MIDRLFALFLNGFTYIRKHPQIVMTLILVIVVPVAFLVSSQQFLTAAKTNQEDLERERIGILHDFIVSVITLTDANIVSLQEEIQKIVSVNSDIESFIVAQEEGDHIRVIASIDTTLIGSTLHDSESYRVAHMSPNTSLLKQKIENATRYWEGYRLVVLDTNETYYLYTKNSLQHMDNLFADRVVRAYYWLFGILAIVLLLIVRHVRLIDYAYLYSETKKANEMKDLFTNMIAHELRAPLTAMRGYASIIREDVHATDAVKHNASQIEESAGRLMLIINDLLDVARIHSGKLSVKSERINVQQVLLSVVDMMQLQAKEKGISIQHEGLKSDVYIHGDEKRLFQAFTNLVSNSIKYTKSGTITLSLKDRRDRIEIRIMDTGMGISAENQKDLFTPFFRIENTETSGTVGTGLGMWITKQLIELMRGSLGVESIRGIGTHIVVTLPK